MCKGSPNVDPGVVIELEPLAGLPSMTELWLSHSRVEDLSPLLPWTEGDHECRRLHQS